MLQTIQKVGPLLDLFTVQRPEWGVSEAAEAIGMPRSSTHALLTSLVDTGLLHSPGRGRYRLGWRIVELYEALRATMDVRAAAAPVMERLNAETGETVNLGVLDRGEVLYLDKLVARQQVGVHGLRVGARMQPHCSALGKVMLAYMNPVEVATIVGPGPLKRFTEFTITDPDALAVELAEIRRHGIAYEFEEVSHEVACAASPIKDPYGAAFAAVSITVPVHRMRAKQAELSRALRSAAHDISRRLADSQARSVSAPLDDPSHWA